MTLMMAISLAGKAKVDTVILLDVVAEERVGFFSKDGMSIFELLSDQDPRPRLLLPRWEVSGKTEVEVSGWGDVQYGRGRGLQDHGGDVVRRGEVHVGASACGHVVQRGSVYERYAPCG